MTPATIVWIYALAALAFGIVAVGEVRRGGGGVTRTAFIVALGTTALWALAIAGIEPSALVAHLAEGLRNVAWFSFMATLRRRTVASGKTSAPARRPAMMLVYAALVLVTFAGIGVALIETTATQGALVESAGAVRQTIRMMAATAALVLVNHLFGQDDGDRRGGLRLIGIALAVLWCGDVIYALIGYITGPPTSTLIAARGAVALLTAPLFGIAASRGGEWTLQLSRTMAMRWVIAGGVALYIALIGIGTAMIGALAGRNAPLAQTAFVCGMTVAVLTVASSPWLRAWLKVVVAKHFYRHRYDYRDEWLRFTDTIGAPDADQATLETRVTKAVADLTDSPAALLLVPDEAGLGIAARWNWRDRADGPAGAALSDYLTATARIVALDAVRAGGVDACEATAIPAWAIEDRDAWAIVPLLHFGSLAGAIVLARPPIDRALDWEDFDLLGLAGRQVASYLAEDRAHAALAEAQRFDEFNRRFAFIMHDLKNLVSQLTLVARNAERHAENPAFRADMVATLKDSADRMNGLLARLSQHHARSDGVLARIDIACLCRTMAGGRRVQHPVVVTGETEALAMADPAAIEILLGHLIQNAIEASAPGEPVMLVVTIDGDSAAVDVIDRGAGMSASFVREQLFKPFASTKPGGFGIGAFEARQLARAMGCTVTVASREGEGTRFRVTLPLAHSGDTALDTAA